MNDADVIINQDNAEYTNWLSDLKKQVRQAQTRAVLAVNTELILLYWNIGQSILERQKKYGWGSKVIEKLATDLKREFPDMKGFSRSNLMYMRAFAQAWTSNVIVLAPLGQITWYHHIALITQLKCAAERLWYAEATVENGWSRNTLVAQIDTRLHLRQGSAITNFNKTIPAEQSELVQQTFKDPYIFDFLTITHAAAEREIEHGLIHHLSKFMLELGKGFAYLGRQYPLQIGVQEYFLDLLFYNVTLHCYVVIDLKNDEFRPEYSGKMQFYLNVLEDTHKSPAGAPPVGIILCRSKNKVIVEYALKDTLKPLGVAQYLVTQTPPARLQDVMPSMEEIQRELDRTADRAGSHVD